MEFPRLSGRLPRSGLRSTLRRASPRPSIFGLFCRPTNEPLDFCQSSGVHHHWLIDCPVFSNLSCYWLLALLAAVDFESEYIRFLGGARFTLWALKKVADGESHSGMVAWTDQPPGDAPRSDVAADLPLDDSLRYGPPLRYLPVQDLSNWQGAAGDFGAWPV
jgi:hypothetical protein